MLTTYQKQAKTKLMATVITLIVIAGIIIITDSLKPKSGSTSTVSITATTPSSSSSTTTTNNLPATTTPPASTSSGSSTGSNTSGYKDGTYSATTDYYVPHGSESIEVSLTLSNGVITNASIRNSEYDRESAVYQEEFASVYKSSVVGKKIHNLQVDVIAGASDTTQGFDDALSQIAIKARA